MMKAWQVEEVYEGCAVIVFAETRNKAKYLAVQYNDALQEYGYADVRAVRMPQLDRYASDKPYVMDFETDEDRLIMVRDAGFRCLEPDYDAPLIITYSGGKDSDVLAHLAVKSEASVEFEHSLTTVDAPDTVHHIQKVFKKLEDMGYKTTIHRPEISMWRLIEKKMIPPTRLVRYCCQEFKESATPNRYIATGVRGGADSARLEWNLRRAALQRRRAAAIR